MSIFKKINKNCKAGKLIRIDLKSSRGSVSLLVIGIIAFVATCYVGAKTEPFIQKAQTQTQKEEGIGNEISPSFNKQDLNTVYELGNFDPNKAATQDVQPKDLLPYPKNQEDVDKYYSLLGCKTLDESTKYYETFILNNKSFSAKTKNLANKYLIYDSTGNWPIDMKDPFADFGEKPGESRLQADIRQKEEVFLSSQYNLYLGWKEDKKLKAENAAIAREKADLEAEVKMLETIRDQKKSAAEKAEIEKNGLANFWIKKLKEKMQDAGILADETTILVRETFLRNNDFINEMQKLSPPPDDLPWYIESSEVSRKWLEENDPLFSSNELIVWLNRPDRDWSGIDPETIAEILKNMATQTTEIAGESSSESTGENGWTDSAQSGESAPGSSADTAAATQPKETSAVTIAKPAETTPETATTVAQPSELNLSGALTNTEGEDFNLTLYINFETLNVSGKISGLYPRQWEHSDVDENGNTIPDSVKVVELQTTFNGSINGTIDINNGIIKADLSVSLLAQYEGEKCNGSEFETMLGTLWEDSTASGTTSSGMVWNVSPN